MLDDKNTNSVLDHFLGAVSNTRAIIFSLFSVSSQLFSHLLFEFFVSHLLRLRDVIRHINVGTQLFAASLFIIYSQNLDFSETLRPLRLIMLYPPRLLLTAGNEITDVTLTQRQKGYYLHSEVGSVPEITGCFCKILVQLCGEFVNTI